MAKARKKAKAAKRIDPYELLYVAGLVLGGLGVAVIWILAARHF